MHICAKRRKSLFGYTSEEMLGQTPAVLYPELEQTQLAADLQQIREAHDYRGLWKGRRKNGTRRLILSSVVLIKDGSGKIMGAVAANRDIPALKSSASMIVSDR